MLKKTWKGSTVIWTKSAYFIATDCIKLKKLEIARVTWLFYGFTFQFLDLLDFSLTFVIKAMCNFMSNNGTNSSIVQVPWYANHKQFLTY